MTQIEIKWSSYLFESNFFLFCLQYIKRQFGKYLKVWLVTVEPYILTDRILVSSTQSLTMPRGIGSALTSNAFLSGKKIQEEFKRAKFLAQQNLHKELRQIFFVPNMKFKISCKKIEIKNS